jgi:crossover junction endodeoxyribonuclease RuvC
MIVLGVDPGTLRLGYSFIQAENINKIKVLSSGVIIPSNKDSIYKRLGFILKELEKLINYFNPDAVSLEKSFYGKNVSTAISLGEVRGVVLSLAGKYNKILEEYTPMAIKKSVTGRGNSDKEAVARMVKKILGIKKDFEYNDESDAIAISLAYVYRSKFNNTQKK